MIVSDASPLILFAKIKKIDLILDLFKEPVIIEETVKKEIIDAGLRERFSDAIYLNKLVNEKKIHVKQAKKFTKIIGIHEGEAKTIFLALELKEENILIDEEDGRAAARALGLKPKGSLFILLQSAKNKKISKKEAIAALNLLIKNNYRISSKYYSQFLEKLEEL
ncbi:MAG TPA: DUF3368 domain-containing protein [archaeon]|nr:DUF3368 domain-containing protein [archaeon]